MKKIDETRNYLLDVIQHNDLMSENYKKSCRVLNHFRNFLVFVSAFSGCASISAFLSLVGILICVITVGIKM